jgi:hypothetical protein
LVWPYCNIAIGAAFDEQRMAPSRYAIPMLTTDSSARQRFYGRHRVGYCNTENAEKTSLGSTVARRHSRSEMLRSRVLALCALVLVQQLSMPISAAQKVDAAQAQPSSPQLLEKKPHDNSSAYTPFLLLMETGSVGSSWLTHVLDSHPKITSAGERTTEVLGLRNHLINAHNAAGKDVQAVGIKVKRDRLRGNSPLGKFYNEKGEVAHGGHEDNIPKLLQMLQQTGSKLVCLYRRNFVKHAVSQVRHHQQAKICHGWETTSESCVAKLANEPLSDVISLAKYIELLEMDANDTLAICDQFEKAAGTPATGGESRARAYAYEDLVYGSNVDGMFLNLQQFLRVDPIDIVGHYNAAQSATIKKVTPVDLSVRALTC